VFVVPTNAFERNRKVTKQKKKKVTCDEIIHSLSTSWRRTWFKLVSLTMQK